MIRLAMVTLTLLLGVSVPANADGVTVWIDPSCQQTPFEGAASGKSLAPNGDGLVIRTTNANDKAQQWTVRKLTAGNGNRERHEIANAANGKYLAVRGNDAVLQQTSDGR